MEVPDGGWDSLSSFWYVHLMTISLSIKFLKNLSCLVTVLPDLEWFSPFSSKIDSLLRGGGGKISLPIIMLYCPEVTLKFSPEMSSFDSHKLEFQVWKKSEMVDFYLDLGCPPPFCLILSFGWGGVEFPSLISLRLSWKFEQNPSWLNFCLIWGGPTPFFA